MKPVLIGLLFYAMFIPISPAQDDDQGPPERSVARISLINGDLSVRRGDSGDVVAAAVNAPVTLEDRLLTASSSRAELQFDSANMLRIGSNAEVRLGDLQYRRYQIQVALGTVTFRVLRASEAQVELDTPILGIRPLRPGIYRVTVREDGSADITVRDGEAEISTRRGSERLQAGSTMLARGPSDDPEFQIAAELGPDEWDRWNDSRDQELQRSHSPQYVSRDVYGAEDLDPYGRWVSDPQYGQVWAPTVSPGWAPYQSGRWVWEDWYGWTWVSYDPWGWAPYHYGRWFYGNAGWCWFPGSTYGRHYWSPALVSFFGFGGRGGVGFGFGNVGWVPLAPYEPLHRWWGRGFYGGRNGFNNTTIVNNVNIANTYRNARAINGVTSVNAVNFGRHSGQFTSMNSNGIREAGVVRGALPVTPDRASLRYADRQVQSSSYRQSNTRQFYSTVRSPSAATRIPFEQQRQVIGASHAWQRFGEPVHGAGVSSGTANYSSGGWQRFGGTAAPSYMSPRNYGTYPSAPSYQSAPAQSPRYGNSGRGGYQPASAPQAPRSQPSRSFGGNSGGGQSQAVHISPSIVHERSSAPAPRGSSGSDRGSSNNQTHR